MKPKKRNARKKIQSRNYDVLNERIRFPKVILIDETNNNLGETPTYCAIEKAKSLNLDLLLISTPTNSLPVTKIVNYGKFKYERSKKAQESRKKQKIVQNKEIRLTSSIALNDLKVKTKKAIEFLEEGDRVRVSLRFRGREMQHTNIGVDTMNRFWEEVKDFSEKESEPKLTNNFLDMQLIPKSKKVKKNRENENEKKQDEDKKSFS